MRCSIARVRVLSVPAFVALLPIVATSCNKLAANGTADTMALLRQGSEKVCIASNVQATLKSLILPKVADVSDDAADEDKLAAIAKVAVSFDLTTLQQFDKAVAKASCSTTVTLGGVGAEPTKTKLGYEVTPSAESPDNFIVAMESDEARSYAKLLVLAALNGIKSDRVQQQQAAEQAQEAAQQAQAEAHVRSVVNDRWLTGVWAPGEAPAGTCATSSAIRFQNGNVLTGGWGNGRWSLAGTELHLVGTRRGQPIDERYTITNADAVSASGTLPDTDAVFSLRRCTAAETQAAPEPGSQPVDVISDQAPQ